MSSMRQPRWFWSEEEEVQPPSRDGWTLDLEVSPDMATLSNLRTMRAAAPYSPKLKGWLCDSLQKRG